MDFLDRVRKYYQEMLGRVQQRQAPPVVVAQPTTVPTPTAVPTPTVIPQTPKRYQQTIYDAASKYNIPANILSAQISAESNFNPTATSTMGAQGISQFMPGTVKDLERLGYGKFDPYNPRQAIPAQAFYLDYLRKQLGVDDVFEALKAYNAGIGNYKKYNGNIPFSETQNYVKRIRGLVGNQ